MSSVTFFVLRMGFMQFLSGRRNQYTRQYLFKEEEYQTLCQILPTLNVPKFLNITCLKFIWIWWLKLWDMYRNEMHNTKLPADSSENKLIRIRVSKYFEKFQNYYRILQLIWNLSKFQNSPTDTLNRKYSHVCKTQELCGCTPSIAYVWFVMKTDTMTVTTLLPSHYK